MQEIKKINLSLNFDYYYLGDLVKIKYGKNQKKVQDDENGQYPIFGTGGLMGYSIEYLYDKPSVLIGRKGSIEKVRYIEEPFWTVDTLFYTEVNKKIVIPKFLYYVMSLIDLSRYNEGTSIPSLRTETLNSLDLPIPDLDYQNRVLSVLSKIDKKIEINEKINKNLEQLLYNIFNNWFISFEKFSNLEFMSSPMGEIPKGWKIGILKDLISLTKNSINPKKTNGLPYLPIDIIPMNSLGITELNSDDEANSSLITFDKNDILIGAMRVYFHRVVLSPVNGVTRSTCFVLKPKKESYLSYSLLLCNLDRTIQYAQNTSKGTTMPYAVWDNGLGDMEVVIPPENILKEFHERVFPIIEKIRDSYYEVNNLTKLRDTLLPKLMSGEIDVSKINCDLKIIIKFILNPLNYFYGGI